MFTTPVRDMNSLREPCQTYQHCSLILKETSQVLTNLIQETIALHSLHLPLATNPVTQTLY